MKTKRNSLIFTFILFVFFCWAAIEANTFSDKASFFPLFTAIISANVSLISFILQLIQYVRKRKAGVSASDEEDTETPISNILYYLGWIAGYVVLIYLIGLIWSTLIFLLAFFLIESKFKVWKAALFSVIVVTIIISFGNLMNLYWPEGLINLGLF